MRGRAHRSPDVRDARRAGVSWTGGLSLLAIVTVLVLVSVSRLQGFALHENENDALRTLRLLSRALLERGEEATPDTIEGLVEATELLPRLQNARFSSDGELLERHGYLFRLVQDSAPHVEGVVLAAENPASTPVRVVAWPRVHGATGHASLCADPGRALFGHANASGRWSGPKTPPSTRTDGWELLGLATP